MNRTTTKGVTMEVLIFGPNLNRAGQSKGDMHVHAAGCGDCKHYGPETRYGGEREGWKVDAETIEDVVEDVYGPDEFGYDPKTEIDAYCDSIYFAPCVKLGSRGAA